MTLKRLLRDFKIDTELWSFLREHSKAIFRIENWEIYRRGAESVREILKTVDFPSFANIFLGVSKYGLIPTNLTRIAQKFGNIGLVSKEMNLETEMADIVKLEMVINNLLLTMASFRQPESILAEIVPALVRLGIDFDQKMERTNQRLEERKVPEDAKMRLRQLLNDLSLDIKSAQLGAISQTIAMVGESKTK